MHNSGMIIQNEGSSKVMQGGAENSLPASGNNLMPDTMSLCLIFYSAFLVNSNYFILFPTVREYSDSFGASETFFGWVISVQSLVQLVTLLPIDYFARRSYKTLLLVLASLGICGNVIYALGPVIGSKYALFVGSLFIGMNCSCWIIYRKYVSEATGSNVRTKVFSQLMYASAFGYTGGPLLGVAVYYINFSIGVVRFNKYTNPGWLMAILLTVFVILVFLYFKEPLRAVDERPECQSFLKIESGIELPQGSSEPENDGDIALLRNKWFRLSVSVCILFPMIAQFFLGALETSVTVVGPTNFDWSTIVVGLFLSAIAMLVIPVGILTGKVSSFVEDRMIVLVSILLSIVGCFCITAWPFWKFSVYQYIFGCIFLFVGQGLMDNMSYCLASKMVPSYATGYLSKGNVLLLLNFGISAGRPLGPLWAAQSTEPSVGVFGVGILCVGLSGVALVLLLIFYKTLVRWDKQNISMTTSK
mmetsp:Transcript_17517/g.28356  ORF Transcript_17517/g.28356 Transcript_17517/m.28356 type:complete len:474 (-) Transcript_17517:80-1501(-)